MSRLLSKNNRVLLLIALMFVSSFVVGGAVFLMTSAQSDEIDAVTNRLTVVGNIDDRISRAVEDQESALDDYVLSRNGDALQRYQAAVQTETAAEPDIQAAVVGLPEVACRVRSRPHRKRRLAGKDRDPGDHSSRQFGQGTDRWVRGDHRR